MPKNRSALGFALDWSPWLVLFEVAIAFWLSDIVSAGCAMAGGILSYASLYLTSIIVSRSINVGSSKLSAISKVQLLMLAKLPIFGLAVYAVVSLGIAPSGWFLAGYLGVYFALCVGAILPESAPNRCDKELS